MELAALVTVNMPSWGAVVALVLTVVLLVCSGFVSASEIAFFALSPSDRGALEESDSLRDRTILRLLERSEKLLATILITNNQVNVTIILLTNYALMSIFDFAVPWVEFLCITVLLTFILLLFGEIMPKLYAANNSLRFCRRVSPVIYALTKIFSPLANMLAKSFAIADKMPQHGDNLSVDDLEQAL